MQITRVSPTEISAEPVAVRTNPGSIVERPQLVRRPAVAALGRRAAGRRAHADHPGAELDVDDLAERHLQEARPECLERLDVGGAAEAVAALAGLRVQQPA